MIIREVIEDVVEEVMSGVEDASKNGVIALPPKEIEISMECSNHRVRVLIPVVGRIAKSAVLLLAVGLLTACPSMQQAYATYDANFEREMVAGHDSVRGDYIEYRVKPRPRALANIATSTAPSSGGRNADAAGTAGKTVVPAQGGKAVLR